MNNGMGGEETLKDGAGENRPFILVAEDTDSNFLLISTLLKKEYSLQRAINGVEAVNICRESSPDLILMDIRMPEMDGLQATREIRQFNTDVPIVALTAFAFEQDRLNALNAGCDGFLTKPLSINELKESIKRFLNN